MFQENFLMAENLFSIILPLSENDNEKDVKNTLKSLLGQYFKDIEILIIKVKIPEEIKSILDSQEDERIKYFEAEDISSAKNIGVENASGKYLYFADTKGNLIRRSFRTLATAIGEQDFDIITFGALIYDKETELENPDFNYDPTFFSEKNNVVSHNDEELKKNFYNLDYPIECRLFKKDFIVKNNLSFDVGISDDLRFWYNCLLCVDKLTFLPEWLYRVCKETLVLKTKITDKNSQEFFDALGNLEKDVKAKTDDEQIIKDLYTYKIKLVRSAFDPSLQNFSTETKKIITTNINKIKTSLSVSEGTSLNNEIFFNTIEQQQKQIDKSDITFVISVRDRSYNELKNTVDLLLNNNVSNTEVLLITDDYENIFEFGNKNKDIRIKFVYANRGEYGNFKNTAIKLAQKDYVYFLNSGDIVSDDIVKTLQDCTNGYDLTIFSNTESPEIFKNLKENFTEKKNGLFIENLFDFLSNDNTSQNFLFKTDFLKRNKLSFTNNIFLSDAEFFIKFFSCRPRIQFGSDNKIIEKTKLKSPEKLKLIYYENLSKITRITQKFLEKNNSFKGFKTLFNSYKLLLLAYPLEFGLIDDNKVEQYKSYVLSEFDFSNNDVLNFALKCLPALTTD